MASGPHKAGNAAEIDRLALALAKEPGSKAFIPLAEEYGKAGMWQEAAAVLEDGLKTYPNFIIALVALGRAYDHLGQPVKAKAVLEEAVRLSPDNLRAHRTLAKIYAAEGATAGALRACTVILTVNPRDEEALSLLATLSTVDVTTTPESPQVEPSNAASDLLVPPSQTESTQVASSAEPALTVVKASLPSTSNPQAVQDQVVPQLTANPAAPVHQAAHVRRLEQWLAAIQARRAPHN
jgi:tetratricopeptide (TPR) repeat protein